MIEEKREKLLPTYHTEQCILRQFFDGLVFICEQIDCSESVSDMIVMCAKKNDTQSMQYICTKFNITSEFYTSWWSVIQTASECNSIDFLFFLVDNNFIQRQDYLFLFEKLDFSATIQQLIQMVSNHKDMKEFLLICDVHRYPKINKIKNCLLSLKDRMIDDITLNCMLPYIDA